MLSVLGDVLVDHVVVPFATVEAYRTGFVTAVVLGLGVNVLFRFVQRSWKLINVVFQPVKEPATKPGKTPFAMMSGCAGQVFAWTTVVIVILMLLKAG